MTIKVKTTQPKVNIELDIASAKVLRLFIDNAMNTPKYADDISEVLDIDVDEVVEIIYEMSSGLLEGLA